MVYLIRKYETWVDILAIKAALGMSHDSLNQGASSMS